MRRANIAMACVFAVFTLVQFNDPDRWLWLALYGYATLVSVSLAQGGGSGLAAIGLPIYAMLAVVMFPGGEEGWIASEGKRETIGLAVCAVWMAVNTVIWLRGIEVEEPPTPGRNRPSG